jgi:hypothetical protein
VNLFKNVEYSIGNLLTRSVYRYVTRELMNSQVEPNIVLSCEGLVVGTLCTNISLDMSFIASCWSWMVNNTFFPTRFLSIARIWNIIGMAAISRMDLCYSRLWLDEDL